MGPVRQCPRRPLSIVGRSSPGYRWRDRYPDASSDPATTVSPGPAVTTAGRSRLKTSVTVAGAASIVCLVIWSRYAPLDLPARASR